MFIGSILYIWCGYNIILLFSVDMFSTYLYYNTYLGLLQLIP